MYIYFAVEEEGNIYIAMCLQWPDNNLLVSCNLPSCVVGNKL